MLKQVENDVDQPGRQGNRGGHGYSNRQACNNVIAQQERW